MRNNYKKLVLGAFLAITSLTSYAQNITLSIENVQVTNDGVDDFYEADIMIASDVDYIQGSGQFFLDYNTAAFGTSIHAASGITYERPLGGSILGSQSSGVDNYNQFTVNDNTASKVSYLWQQFWSASFIGANNVTATPTVLVHIKMKYIDSNEPANVCFDATHPFDDQFYTACGGAAGADCGASPGTQLLDYTPDCSNALSTADYQLNAKTQLYPNPANELLFVKSDTTIDTIEVYTISGRKVLQQAYSQQVNLSSLSSGVYLIKLIAADKHAVKKLIIE